MSAYTVLATRYRPRTFADVVGQEDVARVLRRSLEGGRAPHAWLFSGPRGVGKTSMARILAKALNCLDDETGQPCGACRVCKAIDESGSCLDVVEIDGASHNRVENVRDLIENLRFRPVEARHRIYIVDEVHMLSTAAFNALLKTLEEPPDHAKFILATTEPLKVPETIRSRCQLHDFRRLGTDSIRARLAWVCGQEQTEVAPELLQRVARHARGGLRDALSLLDQLLTFAEGQPTPEDFERLTGRLGSELLHALLGAALEGKLAAVMEHCQAALERGARPADIIGQVSELLEGLLVAAAGGRPADRTDAEVDLLAALAAGTNVDQVVAMLDVMVEAGQRLKQRHDGRLVVEMALLTLARIPWTESIGALIGVTGGTTVRPDATSGRAPSSGRSTKLAPSSDVPTAAPSSGSSGERRPTAPAPVAQPSVEPPSRAAQPPAAAEPADGQVSDDPLAQLRASLTKRARSLSLALADWEMQLSGDTLVLTPPPGGPVGLFDPSQASHRDRLQTLVSEALERRIRIEIAPPPAGRSPAEAAQEGASTGLDDAQLDAQIRRDFPGAQRVDG